MSEYRETNDRVAEIIDRLNRRGIGWQKYDAAPESRAAWKNQEMKTLGDIGLLCAEICEGYVMGEAWILAQDKLKQYDPARTCKDGTGPMPLGEYIKMHVVSKWLKKKVKEEDEKDPGERRQEDAIGKQIRREEAKGGEKTNKSCGSVRVSLDSMTEESGDEKGIRNEKWFGDGTVNVEEEAIKNLEESEDEKAEKLLEALVTTMMAMSLNFGDYRRRLKKEEQAEQKWRMKMCYTERLVWLGMRDYVQLFHMDKAIQRDILRAILKTYYWYWADGKMVYDVKRAKCPVQVEKLVTPQIRELKWMKTKEGEYKGWLEAKIPQGYWERVFGIKLADSTLFDARKGYQQDLYRLYKMAYGRERRPQLERL